YHAIDHWVAYVYQLIIESMIKRDRFLDRHCQGHVQIESLSDLKIDTGNYLLSKTFSFHFQVINPDGEICYDEKSRTVGNAFTAGSGRFLRHLYLRPGDEC